jgi:septum formation protein
MCTDRLILASASPRRRALLGDLCAAFAVEPCPYPEPALRSRRITPRAWAEALAYFKARAISQQHADAWVLGADTIVACEGQILGKPRDMADARRMLEMQGRAVSEVITGVSLVRSGAARVRVTRSAVTRVWMRDDAGLREAYLASGDWAGKAGAYGIQNVGDRLVARYAGSFSNVVGLPLGLVASMLRGVGLRVAEVPGEGGVGSGGTAAE